MNNLIRNIIIQILSKTLFLKQIRGKVVAVSDDNSSAEVLLSIDNQIVYVLNKTNEYLSIGDNVLIYYWTKISSGHIRIKLGKSNNSNGNFENNVIMDDTECGLMQAKEPIAKVNNDTVYLGDSSNDIFISGYLCHNADNYTPHPEYMNSCFNLDFGNEKIVLQWESHRASSRGVLDVTLNVPTNASMAHAEKHDSLSGTSGQVYIAQSGEKLSFPIISADVNSFGFFFVHSNGLVLTNDYLGQACYAADIKIGISYLDVDGVTPRAAYISFLHKGQNHYVLSENDANIAKCLLGVQEV